jgi:hypothetical protein
MSPQSENQMNCRIRIEIIGRDEFWHKAVLVEWEHQYPERQLVVESGARYLIEPEWLVDLARVAEESFSKIVVAPEDPGRRSWLRQFIPLHSDDQT